MTRLIDFEREGRKYFALHWRPWTLTMRCAHFIQFPASKTNLCGFICLNFSLFIQQISGWAYTHTPLIIMISNRKYWLKNQNICVIHIWKLLKVDVISHGIYVTGPDTNKKDESISTNWQGGVCSHFICFATTQYTFTRHNNHSNYSKMCQHSNK